MSEEKNGQILVMTQFSKGRKKSEELHEEELIPVDVFADGVEPAKVSMSMGRTFNLGNFESYRVDIHCSLPCMKEEVVEAFQSARGFVVERMSEEIAAVDQLRAK